MKTEQRAALNKLLTWSTIPTSTFECAKAMIEEAGKDSKLGELSKGLVKDMDALRDALIEVYDAFEWKEIPEVES